MFHFIFIQLFYSFIFMFPSPFTKGLVAPVENGCVVGERSAQYSFSEGSIIENLHEENQILHSSKQKLNLALSIFLSV
jgi:hypothetical protein